MPHFKPGMPWGHLDDAPGYRRCAVGVINDMQQGIDDVHWGTNDVRQGIADLHWCTNDVR